MAKHDWMFYAENALNPIGPVGMIYEGVSDAVASGKEANARAAQAKAEATAAQAAADMKAAQARAAQTAADKAAREEARAARDEAKAAAASSSTTPRSSTIRSPAGVSLGTLGGSSPTPYFIAGAVLIIGAVYYYSRKR